MMDWMGGCAQVIVLLVTGILPAGGSEPVSDEPVQLRETAAVGDSTRVAVTLNAEGIRPGMPARRPAPGQPAAPDAAAGQELPFRSSARTRWLERVRQVNESGQSTVAVRRLESAEGKVDAFRGLGQTAVLGVRPEVGLLVGNRRGADATVVVTSAGGPLTREELDLVQGACDPLTLSRFLPPNRVKLGDRWELGQDVARAVSEYEQIKANSLRGRLAALDDTAARIELTGEIKGTVRGAEGSVLATGELIFDRVGNRVRRLRLERQETRTRGHVESALDVKSSLEITREGIEVPAELSDAALADLPLEPEPARELLILGGPGGKSRLLHDRNWHVTSSEGGRIVLRRVEGPNLVARFDVVAGPNAGAGRHQDPEQFRVDVEKALGANVGRVTGSGEVGGSSAGGFRYKVGLEGLEQENGDVPIWYYYLAAGPQGDQLIAIFTLSRASEPAFGDQDLRVIGSLEWVD